MKVRVGARGAIALTQLLIATGVVVGGGAVGVGLQQAGVIGGGDETVEVALDAVPTLDCPGGSEIGELHRGDRVLATSKDDPGDFVEVRDPRDLSGRVWVAARYLVPDADLSGLDVRECGVEVAAAPTTTLLVPFPGPGNDDDGGPGPAPGPPPDTTGPSIGAVSAQPALIFTSGGVCTNNTSLVTVSVSDPSGVQSVSVAWAVSFGGGASGNGTPEGSGFRVGPQPFSPNLPDNTPVTLTITALDNAGNQSQVVNTTALKVSKCP